MPMFVSNILGELFRPACGSSQRLATQNP